jgi:hypothetical protein
MLNMKIASDIYEGDEVLVDMLPRHEIESIWAHKIKFHFARQLTVLISFVVQFMQLKYCKDLVESGRT